MIQIYHNPRCRKSREGLAIVAASEKDFEVVEYLKDIPSEEDLKQILTALKLRPLELVRKNEAVWKENYRGKELTDDEIVKAMVANPKLIERPIILKGGKAIIGRPAEKITEFLKEVS